MISIKKCGQATVEYIFILAFIFFLSGKATQLFQGFFRDNMGKIGHYLSQNLIVGVCATKCWYPNYNNGFGNR